MPRTADGDVTFLKGRGGDRSGEKNPGHDHMAGIFIFTFAYRCGVP
jgi:hypothetical protein